MPRTPRLIALELGAPAAAWTALGFAVEGGHCRIGDVDLVLRGGGAPGLRGWTLAGAGAGASKSLDGLPTVWTPCPAHPTAPAHPNGATRLDHVVVLTDALERTVGALEPAGLGLRRIRDAGDGRRQAFLWLGERQLLLEVVEAPGVPAGRAAFWGMTVVVEDLDAAAERLGPALGEPKDAVQPGRRIATVRREAGLGAPVALITPHPGAPHLA